MFHDAAFIEAEPIISYPTDNRDTGGSPDSYLPDKGNVTQSCPPDKGGEGGSLPDFDKADAAQSYPPDKGEGGSLYIPYNETLTQKARENRQNPTAAEKKLWYEVLANKQLDNLKFTRQKPLDAYIVDFYCPELKLAIEIDGDTHADQEQYDKRGTEDLKGYGIEVIRYTNAEVLDNLDGVYQDLRERISGKKPPISPLSGGQERDKTRLPGDKMDQNSPRRLLSESKLSEGQDEPPASPLSGGQEELPTVAVKLTDFSVFYSQDSISNAEQKLQNKRSRIVVEQGKVVKVSKDANGIISREVLTKHWTDWIDYWSVDFDFESKREIIRVQDPGTGEWTEQWTGDYIFENEWQSFRTKKDRSLELTSAAYECAPGRRKLAVKVVDIFGNDTMTIIEVTV